MAAVDGRGERGMEPDPRQDSLLEAIDRQLEGVADRIRRHASDAAERAHGFLMIDLLDEAGAPLDAARLRTAGLDVDAIEARDRFRSLEKACLARGWSIRALLHWEDDAGVLRIVVDIAG